MRRSSKYLSLLLSSCCLQPLSNNISTMSTKKQNNTCPTPCVHKDICKKRALEEHAAVTHTSNPIHHLLAEKTFSVKLFLKAHIDVVHVNKAICPVRGKQFIYINLYKPQCNMSDKSFSKIKHTRNCCRIVRLDYSSHNLF